METKVLFLLLLATVVGCIAGAEVPDKLDWLPAKQRAEAKELIPSFDKIETYLVSSKLYSTDQLMNLLKMISQQKSRIYQSFFGDQQKKAKTREALNLFLSLAQAAKSCDFASYQILAMNHIALEADLAAPHCSSRSISIYRDYAAQHAKHCRTEYKKASRKVLKSRDEHVLKSFEIVDKLLSNVDPNKQLLDSPEGRSQLVDDLLNELLETKGSSGLDMRTIFEDHLANPCSVYYDKFKEALAPAVYDLAFDETDNINLRETLQPFRVCSYVDANREPLYQRMMNLIKIKQES